MWPAGGGVEDRADRGNADRRAAIKESWVADRGNDDRRAAIKGVYLSVCVWRMLMGCKLGSWGTGEGRAADPKARSEQANKPTATCDDTAGPAAWNPLALSLSLSLPLSLSLSLSQQPGYPT